ncbi:hypothetical protein EB796_024392 [Bugula neritina]|uniref:Uncharacterized protein n=1 Tax=Bugula neritina TaxID=10212 RepID=A0A7J7IU44_BUGNE|nr:hypothetical protein EB796_024392 [Bugula neritina]
MTHLEEILSAVNELQGERVAARTAMCCTAATPNRKCYVLRGLFIIINSKLLSQCNCILASTSHKRGVIHSQLPVNHQLFVPLVTSWRSFNQN